MDKEKKVTIEDLMQENLDFQNKINVLEQEKTNFQKQINDTNEQIKSYEEEIKRLQGVNQQFFLQLSKQEQGQIKQPIQDKQQNDNTMSFDDFIDKLI